MKFAACLGFVTLAAFLMQSDANPHGGLRTLSDLGNGGIILLHTSGIEKGHQHTANGFGGGPGGGPEGGQGGGQRGGQGGGPPPTTAATTTTTASSG
ncbi:holotricin-3-like [Anoplophora glabripennis]|uniref:holotricin-3-like n=1 Tax=Anoplophora glabripennis TaxID=217634 RepID=UPI000873E782|nr:holotricin-3-like [Anoplophora glabripennis]